MPQKKAKRGRSTPQSSASKSAPEKGRKNRDATARKEATTRKSRGSSSRAKPVDERENAGQPDFAALDWMQPFGDWAKHLQDLFRNGVTTATMGSPPVTALWTNAMDDWFRLWDPMMSSPRKPDFPEKPPDPVGAAHPTGIPSGELLSPLFWTEQWNRFNARTTEAMADLVRSLPRGPEGLRLDASPMDMFLESLNDWIGLSWFGLTPKLAADTLGNLSRQALEYGNDLVQRWVLFMDTLRQRGNNMLAHYEAGMPPLLDYDYEVILDARTFERPANYLLLRIIPPDGREPAPNHRPMVIIDPRAGHGPGIGGFRQDSEVGMGLLEGHPVYFVVFTPNPVPGQTIEDVELAQVRFIEEVYRRHPDLERPMVYGNCQAGWAVAMLGADRPDVTGPIVINGAPLSYWAGDAGVNPMRVTGGLVGGSWATRLLCDLDMGLFDGAYLVMNFESLNPANTFWKKEYRLFDKVDSERPRYLDFERWWTGFYFLNEEEILWIVDNLFIGDKLEAGKLRLSAHHHVDMRNMDDPLVIFASSGDNISPPHQALNWISEVYEDIDDLKRAGQRIVYLLNPHIGHLGIFVSAKVARKEHRAIIEHIERIRALPPGLYEMKIRGETGKLDPLDEQFVVDFEERRIEDVRFPFDRKAFAKTAEVSRANEELYLRFVRPWLRLMVTPVAATSLKWLNPARLNRYLFSDRVTPAMKVFDPLARHMEKNRRPTDDHNTFRYTEHRISDSMEALFDTLRQLRDNSSEALFDLVYL